MFEFITAGPNLPFSVALLIMIFIALLEGVGTLFGVGLSNLIETIIPDMEIDIDADLAEADSSFAMSKVLGWLQFGRVPALILLVVFLTAFGLVGLGIQKLAVDIFDSLMPGSLAALLALTASFPLMRILGGTLARILPKDETSAVSEKTFIGRVATITLGSAKKDSPAEAKLEDQYGQSHYLMVEPDVDNEEFRQGEQVLLVGKAGAHFKGIRNTSSALAD
jgi:hypothetical protein